MKSIAYAIVSASSFALGCLAPNYVDRVVMTAIGLITLVLLAYQEPTK